MAGSMARQAGLVALAGLAGLGWGQPGMPGLIGISVVLPALWALAASRWMSFAVPLAYYLAAARAMPGSSSVFFGEQTALLGLLMWLGVAAVNAGVWAALWNGRQFFLRSMAALVLTALPPIGLVGWANPVTAAGVYFPGLGFAGVGLVLFLASSLAVVANRRTRDSVAVVASVSLLAVAANAMAMKSDSSTALQWRGQNTSFGKLASGSADHGSAYRRIQYIKAIAKTAKPGEVVVLPETVAGLFTDATREELMPAHQVLQEKSASLIFGAEIRDDEGLKNVLVSMGAGSTDFLEQRVPVPVSMWKPWSSDSFVARPFGAGVAEVAGQDVAYLICYEQILVMPVLMSMSQKPSLIVGAANAWWARDTSVPVIQHQALTLWGRLFGKPVVQAVNV